jgi:hypothetical protein
MVIRASVLDPRQSPDGTPVPDAAIAEPGGSARPDEVAHACAEHGIGLVRTGLRLFRH